ncbi:unnamed protein product [Caretta caretta]
MVAPLGQVRGILLGRNRKIYSAAAVSHLFCDQKTSILAPFMSPREEGWSSGILTKKPLTETDLFQIASACPAVRAEYRPTVDSTTICEQLLIRHTGHPVNGFRAVAGTEKPRLVLF